MSMTMCNTAAAGSIATDATTNSIELTELVKGRDQALLDQVGPLVVRQSIALNIASIERIDAAGIAALVTLYSTACRYGHSFTVFNASPRVAKILSLVGLDRILLSQNAAQNSRSGRRLQCSAA